MNNITKNLGYGVFAIAAVSVMVFVVLPQLPQVKSAVENVSMSAAELLAYGGGGGEGGCCGGGGGGGGGGEGPGDPPPPIIGACIAFSASPTQVPHGGGNTTLSWQTQNAERVTLTGHGDVGANSSKTVHVASNTTFTLTVYGQNGASGCQVTVTVAPPPPPTPAKCDYLNISPTTLPHGGGNVTLTWQTTDATSVSITGVGGVAGHGSKAVSVTQTTTFTLTAVGAGGNDSCTAKVTVAPPPQLPADCHFLTASPTTLPHGGGNVTLTWETTNATSVSINGVNAPADGNTTVSVTNSTTFTLTAVGAGGNDTCTASVTVGNKPPEKTPECHYLRTSADEVDEGDYVTLSWETTDATDVSIDNGVGSVPADGSERVQIDDDTTFTLTARNAGKSDTCTVRVEVEEEEEEDEDDARCDLDISDRTVKVGDKITLEWDVRDADEFEIEDDRGNTIHRDRSPGSRERGEEDIVITRDTRFTLKADGKDGGDDDTCRVDVEVEDSEILVLSERDQGKVAGIALTQVPYTGFEAGPMLTMLFYALLVAWALFVAYTLVIRRDSILGFSLAGANTDDNAYDFARETNESAYAASVATPVADAPANLPTGTSAYGYASYAETVEEETVSEEADALKALEDHAHGQHVLFSSDALRHLEALTNGSDAFATLDAVIASAKATYPSEDGWMVINLARLEELTASHASVAVATDTEVSGAGSLAEAIVTGNVVAAYQLIEHRPMIALADAAAEFDAVYRMYQGNPTGTATVSELLKAEIAQHSTDDLKAAITALTGALDGTYTDEASAVKMAIMKAVQVFAK